MRKPYRIERLVAPAEADRGAKTIRHQVGLMWRTTLGRGAAARCEHLEDGSWPDADRTKPRSNSWSPHKAARRQRKPASLAEWPLMGEWSNSMSALGKNRNRQLLADCTHPACAPIPDGRPRPNNQTPINRKGVCHGSHSTSGTLEQRQARRPETTPEASATRSRWGSRRVQSSARRQRAGDCGADHLSKVRAQGWSASGISQSIFSKDFGSRICHCHSPRLSWMRR
jgi:hypothetical protein